MSAESPLHEIEKIDIYLLDQILKGRYHSGEKILDAGCGEGRNCCWFANNSFEIYGIDTDSSAIEKLRSTYPLFAEKFNVSTIENAQFEKNTFDHIVCNAVLHFAENTAHFNEMLTELVRTLKPKGTLFIRMTSDIGIEHLVKDIGGGKYIIPDGSERFLLKRQLLDSLLEEQQLTLLEPLKTVNVNDIRAMSTLILQKQ